MDCYCVADVLLMCCYRKCSYEWECRVEWEWPDWTSQALREEEEEDLFIFNGTNAIYSRARGMVCMLSMFCTAHSHSHTEIYNVRAVKERFNIDPSLNRKLFCSIGSNIWEGSDNCEKRQPSGAVAGVCVCVCHTVIESMFLKIQTSQLSLSRSIACGRRHEPPLMENRS